MQKIAIIVAYFGKMPSFYKAWEKTAIANDTIDFYLFTDDESILCQKNIFVKKTSFSEFKELIQSKFDFKISLGVPYKLCDYKPTYGLVFEDLLKEYDWWGYCDTDLLLGDIRKFFTDSVLAQNDRCQQLGHLCIYRNSKEMTTLFMEKEGAYPALNYDDVYKTDEAMYFDEARGMLTKSLLNHISTYCEESFRDPMEGERKFYNGLKNKKAKNNYIIFWQDGHLYCQEKSGKRTELLYAHFFRRHFLVEECDKEIENIKISPKQVNFNCIISDNDFNLSEGAFYKAIYNVYNIYKSLKRYGLKRTIERQRWTRDHNKYIEDLRKNEL